MASFKLCKGAAVTDDSILLPEAANVIYVLQIKKMFRFRLLTSVGQIKISESSCGIEQQTVASNHLRKY